MFRNFSLLLAHFLFWISSIPNTARLIFDSNNVERVQRRILQKIVRKNHATAYGQKHGFDTINTVGKYQDLVPVNNYEDLLPFIQEATAGKKRVLTNDPVFLFEPTSGSTSASKLIPYTNGLKQNFRMGLDPWIFSLYVENPELFSGSVHWSLTPSQQEKKYTNGDILIGFAEDEEYFGKLQQWVLNTITTVPREVKQIRDLNLFRYITLLFLIVRRDLRLISIWNPTYLSLLLGELPKIVTNLVKDIGSGEMRKGLLPDTNIRDVLEQKFHRSPSRAKEIQAILLHRDSYGPHEKDGCGKTLYEEIWPELAVISCWCDGTAAFQINEIKKMFPRVKIQPKGLIATEAFVSFPFFSNHSILSVHSHFFEFEEVDTEKVFLAHELKYGNRYKIIVTTSGGLYRYALGDIVEVVGFWRKTPTLRFIGRGDHVVDVVGEKLNEAFVDRSISRLLDDFGVHPVFWMMAPEKLTEGSYRYLLFLEFPQEIEAETFTTLSEAADEALQENYHYSYARKLGQLSPLSTFVIDSNKNGSSSKLFLETCYRLGQQLGAIKPTRLHRYEHWTKEFSGSVLKTNP